MGIASDELSELSETDPEFQPDEPIRSGKRISIKKKYLAGTARNAYRVSPELSRSLKDVDNPATTSEWNERVCNSCAPVLQKYATTFSCMKQHGSELKKRKYIYPHPKRPDTEHYRDLVKQNEWLRNNFFDVMGNYLFCCACIHNGLGVSYRRLTRQRNVKRMEHTEPIRSMTKAEVEEGRLSKYVVMPPACDLSFIRWWKTLSNTDTINVKYPHSRHGNAGKPSNSAKTNTKARYLEFIDTNSQPNGRSADSSSATHFFLPKFSTIQIPKHGVPRYEQRVKESLVGEFNRVQKENEMPTISNYSGSTWLKKERPKHSVYPHKLDYCDTCASLNEKIRAQQTTLNRIRQFGSTEEEDQTSLETSNASLNKELEVHKDEAQRSHKYYTDVTKQCKEHWEEITRLELKDDKTEEESEKLVTLKNNFTLTLSVDYQMQKLVPYWGHSPQPCREYILSPEAQS